jgi:two-component system LytT family response regulator
MKVIIIDDEQKARNLISLLIKENFSQTETVYEASNLEDGVKIIKEFSPEIVFLDIEMPNHSGLEIINFFEPNQINFQIIFVTAYNDYAIQAFKIAATDYLLKPVDVLEFKLAIEKAKKNIDSNKINSNLSDLKRAFHQMTLNKIVLDVPKGILFVSHDDIIMFEADGMYTKVYMKNEETQLICKPLKHFAQQLESKSIFYKPHRSYLINLKYLKELSKKDGYYLIMENKKTIPIAKDNVEEFMQLINSIF